MWKWASTKGGVTSRPRASISRPAVAWIAGPISAMCPSLTAMSCATRPSGRLAPRTRRSSIGFPASPSLSRPGRMAAPAAQYADSRPLLHGLLPDAGSRLWNAALTGDPRPAGPAPDHRGPCEGVAVLCQGEDQLQKKTLLAAEQDDETLDNVEQSPAL